MSTVVIDTEVAAVVSCYISHTTGQRAPNNNNQCLHIGYAFVWPNFQSLLLFVVYTGNDVFEVVQIFFFFGNNIYLGLHD